MPRADQDVDEDDPLDAPQEIVWAEEDLAALHDLFAKYGRDSLLKALPKGKGGRHYLSDRAHYDKIDFFQMVTNIVDSENCTITAALEQAYHIGKVAHLREDQPLSDAPHPNPQEINTLRKRYEAGKKDLDALIAAMKKAGLENN